MKLKSISILVSSFLLGTSLMAATPVVDKNVINEKQVNLLGLFEKLKMNKDVFLNSISDTSVIKTNKSIKLDTIYNLDDIYFVQGNFVTPQGMKPFEVFVTKNGKVINSSQMFTEDGMPFFIPKNMTKYDKSVSLELGEATSPDKTLYVFTDIDCPYCKKFTEKYEDVIKKGYQLKLFLFPLDKLHKDSRTKSEYILSLPSNVDKLAAIKSIEGSKNSNKIWQGAKVSEDAKSKLKKSAEVAKELQVRGTPTVLNGLGKKVNWTQL